MDFRDSFEVGKGAPSDNLHLTFKLNASTFLLHLHYLPSLLNHLKYIKHSQVTPPPLPNHDISSSQAGSHPAVTSRFTRPQFCLFPSCPVPACPSGNAECHFVLSL